MIKEYLEDYLLNIESIKMIQDTLYVNLPKKINYELAKYQDALLRDIYFQQLLHDKVDKNLEKKVLNEIEIVRYDKNEKYINYKFKNKYNSLSKYKSISEANKTKVKGVATVNTMYNNTLLSTIILFERCLTGLLNSIIKKYPNAYLNDKKITYSDLMKYENLADIQNKIIDQQTDEMMRESIFTVIKILNEKHKLKINLEDDKYLQIFIEGYLRRNIIVHNNSKINDDYINGMKKIGKVIEEKERGKKVRCTKEYNDKIIDSAIYSIIYIMYRMSMVLFPDEKEEYIDEIIDFGFDKIKEGEYEISRALFKLIKDDDKLNTVTKVYALINYWQCFKWDNKYDEIKEEVEKFDMSAYEDIIKLAIYVLRDDFDSIKIILNSEFNEEKQNKDLAVSLEDFPIFKELRKKQFYKELKQKYSDVFVSIFSKVNAEDLNENEDFVKDEKGKYSVKIKL